MVIIGAIVSWRLIRVDHGPSSEVELIEAPTHSFKTATLPFTTPLPATTTTHVNNEIDEIKKEYQEVAYSLAQKIDKSDLEVTLLNDWASKLNREEFLQKLPTEIREGYENLEKIILKVRDRHLKEDGMTESFFTKYKIEMPEWLQKRRQELEAYSLPSDVAAVVSTKASENEITDNDVANILRGCGKQNNNCIEKAFALLIDANHALNNDQLKKIQEYL